MNRTKLLFVAAGLIVVTASLAAVSIERRAARDQMNATDKPQNWLMSLDPATRQRIERAINR